MDENHVHDRDSFFSVPFDLIAIDQKMTYDLFINSSGNVDRERFVRIFPIGGILSSTDLATFREKYHQLYVLEEQRSTYLKSISKAPTVTPEKKTEVIKDSAIHYLSNIFDESKEFNTELLEETIEGCRDTVESMVDVVQEYGVDKIKELIGNLSFHDFYTFDHSINVSMYCISILRAIDPDIDREQLVLIGLGGLLHDLGKIKVPTNIINAPGKLTEEEFGLIKKHPDWGDVLMKEQNLHVEGVDLEVVRRMMVEHHENVDGSGYPRKLTKDDIHYYARIAAVADFFDAVTTKRSYHEVVEADEAMEIMGRTVGKKLDGDIFKIFAKSANQVIQKRRAPRELEDDFDPSRPYEHLPFKKLEAKRISGFTKGEEKNVGKVKRVSLTTPKIKKKKSS